jgi:hypothetical protein
LLHCNSANPNPVPILKDCLKTNFQSSIYRDLPFSLGYTASALPGGSLPNCDK